jgi:glycosyltransferase involved in cell wall biosynthesis
MKRLLVIANLHHAFPRIPALIAPLLQKDWKVTVITPSLGESPEITLGIPKIFLEKVEIVETPFRGDVFWPLRKLLNIFGFSGSKSYREQIKDSVGGPGRKILIDNLFIFYKCFFAIPDTEWPWGNVAKKKAREILAKYNFDVIISSSPYPTVHRVASKLKEETGVPWIADFRDPWSQNHNNQLPLIRRKIDCWLEKRTLFQADLITTVSKGFAKKLKTLHMQKIEIIRNGFQSIHQGLSYKFPKEFTLSYTGAIYENMQDPEKILVALRNLIDRKEIDPALVRLNFYGQYYIWLQKLIETYNLTGIVEQKGFQNRDKIQQIQRESHLLLLFQWEDSSEEGILPLKFYEYLDTGRPIMATGGADHGEIGDILRVTKTGFVVNTISKIEKALRKNYKEYLHTGSPSYKGKKSIIKKYSYEVSAEKLIVLLDKLATAR